jgi:hypothetical protein
MSGKRKQKSEKRKKSGYNKNGNLARMKVFPFFGFRLFFPFRFFESFPVSDFRLHFSHVFRFFEM